jgi:peptide-methionine (S)-S-oxide reductase|tara:strand:+ start:15559 stop:15723 length:165 start_codon:yes stop_codon:yes gene_type:complete
MSIEKIAMGGECHGYTEAVFQSLAGVDRVEHVTSIGDNDSFSEGVIVHFNSEET